MIDDEQRDDPNWGKVYEGPEQEVFPYAPLILKLVLIGALGLVGVAVWGLLR